MNYNKIKQLCETKKITIHALCNKIGISEPGFYGMIKNMSMRIETLENISAVLNVPVKIFFDDEPDNNFFVNESNVNYGNNNVIISKDKQIHELQKENDMLKINLMDKEKIIKLLEKKK